MSVFVDRCDYDRARIDVTYHELCQSILNKFAASIRAFMSNQPLQAIEILGGRNYPEKRKKIFRSQASSIGRMIGAVVVVVVLAAFSVLMAIALAIFYASIELLIWIRNTSSAQALP